MRFTRLQGGRAVRGWGAASKYRHRLEYPKGFPNPGCTNATTAPADEQLPKARKAVMHQNVRNWYYTPSTEDPAEIRRRSDGREQASRGKPEHLCLSTAPRAICAAFPHIEYLKNPRQLPCTHAILYVQPISPLCQLPIFDRIGMNVKRGAWCACQGDSRSLRSQPYTRRLEDTVHGQLSEWVEYCGHDQTLKRSCVPEIPRNREMRPHFADREFTHNNYSYAARRP